MRLGKSDPTGNHWYDADSVDPASPSLAPPHLTAWVQTDYNLPIQLCATAGVAGFVRIEGLEL